jgi:hypothetical protein
VRCTGEIGCRRGGKRIRRICKCCHVTSPLIFIPVLFLLYLHNVPYTYLVSCIFKSNMKFLCLILWLMSYVLRCTNGYGFAMLDYGCAAVYSRRKVSPPSATFTA